MNEFLSLNKEDMEKLLFGLIAYREGCIDTFNLISEQHRRTLDFYNNKISLAETELEKLQE